MTAKKTKATTLPPAPPPVALPVIQTEDLNAAFNLPVSKDVQAIVANMIVARP